MTKKILSLLMIFTILIGCMNLNFTVSADPEIYSTEAIAHLKNLGIFSTEIDGDEVMTRGEFANAVYKMVGKNVVYDSNYVFYDAGASHPYSVAINYCAQNGYMMGNGGLFRPDDSITFIEGMTVIARVLNYTEYARNNGDYTLGYYTTARNIGLLTNTGITSSNDPMLVRNAAAMFYNALRCNASKLVSINPLYHEYTDSSKVFAYETLGLNYAKGIMTSNGDCDITGKGNTGKYTIIVDNTMYSSKLLDYSYKFYLGQEVSLFYDSDANVVSIVPTGVSDVISFAKDDFSSKSGNTYKYYKGDDLLKVNVLGTATYLKNGKTVVDFKATGFESAEFADMTLIDGDDDNVYEYVFVNVYTTFVVNSVSSDYVVTSVNNTHSVDLSGENGKRVYVFDNSGELKSPDYIYPDYVLSVIETEDFVYAVYANSKASGTITGKDEYLITIDEMEIDVPNGTDKIFKNLDFGDSVTVYFDFAGRAVYVIDGYVNDTNGPHGFLIDSVLKVGLDKKLQLKILNNDGNIQIYEVGDIFRVDGKQYKRSAVTDDSMFRVNGEVNNTVILFKLNDDGKIISVTFPKSEINYNEDGFIKTCSREKAQIISNGTLTTSAKKDDGTYFSGLEFINANTTIFIVPNDLSDEDSYAVTQKSYIPLSTNLTWDIFHFSKHNGYADVAVIYGEYAQTSFDSSLSVVTSIGRAYDEKGNEVVSIKAFTNNTETAYTAPAGLEFTEYKYDIAGNKASGTVDVESLKPGDIVRLATNKDGHVRQGERIYEYNATKYAFKGSTKAGAYATHSLYLAEGYVSYNDKSLLRLAGNKDDAMTLDGGVFKMPGFVFSSAKIYFVNDSKRGVDVSIGTVGDIAIGDYVIYQGRAGVAKYLVVFKDKQ